MDQFTHITAISEYNHNYYNGFGKDLLYAKSDDDNTTEWYLMGEIRQHIGYSFTSEGDKLHLGEYT